MKQFSYKIILDKYVLSTLFIIVIGITVWLNVVYREEGQHFIELAQSFLQGRLDLMYSAVDRGDIAAFNGKSYWPLGPFPAVLVTPFVAFLGNNMTVGYLAVPLIVLTTLFLGKVLLKKGFNTIDSLWLIFAFLFASPYLGVAWVPRSWQFSHVVVVFLMSWALYEFYFKKRYWFIGILFALILATRATAALGVIFFILEILWAYRRNLKKMIYHVLELGLPMALSLMILFAYNYLRFGSYVEFGYALANLGPDLNAMRSYGVLSFHHIPINMYHSIIAPPNISTTYPYLSLSKWGMGIIYSAPYYVALIWQRLLDRTNIFLWITIVITAIPLFMYFGIGPYQLSFRYSLDFLPLLFLVFVRTIYTNDKKLNVGYKFIIVLAFLINFYLFAV